MAPRAKAVELDHVEGKEHTGNDADRSKTASSGELGQGIEARLIFH
jgi:hypothetical protein